MNWLRLRCRHAVAVLKSPEDNRIFESGILKPGSTTTIYSFTNGARRVAGPRGHAGECVTVSHTIAAAWTKKRGWDYRLQECYPVSVRLGPEEYDSLLGASSYRWVLP